MSSSESPFNFILGVTAGRTLMERTGIIPSDHGPGWFVVWWSWVESRESGTVKVLTIKYFLKITYT